MGKERGPEGAGPRSPLRALLKHHGIRPRKALGQNFLTDPNFARAVARAAEPDARTVVLEIGPGTGSLTRALLAGHPRARVLAVELDPRLAGLLKDELAPEIDADRLTLIEGDALRSKHALNSRWVAELRRISSIENRPRRILCANLPYQIAGPLIANLAVPPEDGGDEIVDRIVVTVQLEMAEKLLGVAGSKNYGPLAAFLALRAEGRILRRVGPEAFWPRPKVSSAVLELRLKPWTRTPLSKAEANDYLALLGRLFGRRRKALRGCLRGKLAADDPRAAMRAESLAPEELLRLFRDVQGSL